MQVLWRNGVERFRGGRQPQRQYIPEQCATDRKAILNLKGIVEVGVIDQTLPADSCSRLLKVNAHDEVQVASDPF